MLDIKEIWDLPGTELLTPERRSRMQRYMKQADQARCLGAGLLLRYGLGVEAAAKIEYHEYGKPVLPQGPCFNLSHSGDKVVLLLHHSPCGVDIERVRTPSPAVIRRIFTPEEQLWLSRQEGNSGFFYLWTAKESVMKATGMGFRLAPEQICVLPDSPLPIRALGQNWYPCWQELEDYVLCCTADSPFRIPPLRCLTRQELLLPRADPT